MITFVTGKGGVGKTRVSLLWAQKYPQAHLTETADALELRLKELSFSHRPEIVRFPLEDLAREFLDRSLPLKAISKILGKSSLFQHLLELAPNLHELLLLERWTQYAQKQHLIVDAPSTGHFIALFQALKMAREFFDGGSLKKLAQDLDERFREPNFCEVVTVSIAEHSSLEESEQIEGFLKTEMPSIQIIRLINRLHTPPLETSALSAPWRDFGLKRFAHEQRRIQNRKFDIRLSEGEASL